MRRVRAFLEKEGTHFGESELEYCVASTCVVLCF